MELNNLFFHQQSAETCVYFKQSLGHSFKVSLTEMPHFKFLKEWMDKPYDKNSPYYKYISSSWITDDFNLIKRQIDKYISLYEDVKSKKCIEVPVVLLKIPNENNYLIVDGNHRCSISKLTGIKLNYEEITIEKWLSQNSPQGSAFAKNSDGLLYQTLKIDNIIINGRRSDVLERTSMIRQCDIVGKNILDLGCNIGMQSFSAKQNGASKVLGLEKYREMTSFACRLNNFYGLSDVDFKTFDLNNVFEHEFDTVFCFSIDSHIENKKSLVDTLKKAKNCIYLEGHEGTDEKHYDFIFKEFTSYELLGYCSNGIHANQLKTRPFYRIKTN